MKMLRTGIAAAALALTFSGTAQAGPLFDPGLSGIFFKNFENLYRTDAACAFFGGFGFGCMAASPADPAGYKRVDATAPGNVFAGDVFAGILNIQNVDNQGGTSSFLEGPASKFTGYFAQEVAAVTGMGASGILTLTTATADPFGILGAGEMFRLYSGVTTFSSGGTVTSGIERAIGMSVGGGFGAAGDGGDLGKFWGSFGLGLEGFAYTSTDLGAAGSGTTISTAFLALDLIDTGATYSAGTLKKINDSTENTVGGSIADVVTLVCSAAEIADPLKTCTDTTGITRVNGNSLFGGLSPWQFASNDPFNVNRVPEPGTLALLGLSLAGLSLVRRRKAV